MSELIIVYKNHNWAIEIGDLLIKSDDFPFIAVRQYCSEKDFKTTIPHPSILQTVQDVLAEMGLCEPVKPIYEGDPQTHEYKKTDAEYICTKYPSLVGSEVLIPGTITQVEPWKRFQINNDQWVDWQDGEIYLKGEQSGD